MRVRRDNRFYTRFIIAGAILIAFAVLCLGWANNQFDNECKKKGGTVGNTSNGYHTCSVEIK